MNVRGKLVPILLAPVFASGNVLFDNLGDGFDPVAGYDVDETQKVALPFSSLVTADLSLVTLTLAASHFGSESRYNISIVQDQNGLPAGTTLYQWTDVAGLGLTQLIFATQVQVTNGGSYWVLAEPYGDHRGVWLFSLSSSPGDFAFTSSQGWTVANGTQPGLRVEAVPEPVTFLGLGFGVFLVRNRLGLTKKKAP